VAGDARALFAERFLGDLNDDFLSGLQHFADELRTARAMMAVAVMAMTMLGGAAGAPAFETPTTAAAAITAPVGAATTAAGIVTVSAAAERTLETGARIATDASGLARECALRFSAGMRRTSFAGKKESIFRRS